MKTHQQEFQENQTLIYSKNQALYTITHKRRNIFVLETSEGHTIRRTENFLREHFTIATDSSISVKITPSNERVQKDLDSLRKHKKVSVDVKELERRAKQEIDMEGEDSDVVRLETNEKIANHLKIFPTVINNQDLYATSLSYITEKFKTDDWSRLYMFCSTNRKSLKKYSNKKLYKVVNELAVDHIDNTKKTTTLDYDKTIIPLKELLSKIESNTDTFEDVNKVLVTLPNTSLRNEFTYYVYAITGKLFSKEEFGFIRLPLKYCEENILPLL